MAVKQATRLPQGGNEGGNTPVKIAKYAFYALVIYWGYTHAKDLAIEFKAEKLEMNIRAK